MTRDSYQANVYLNMERDKHFVDNLDRYIAEHPGDWIVIDSQMKERFYKHKRSAMRVVRQDKKYGPGYLMRHIPLSRLALELKRIDDFEKESRRVSIEVK